MGRKAIYLHFRADPKHDRRLTELVKATGLTRAEVLRRLLESAAIVPVGDLRETLQREGQHA